MGENNLEIVGGRIEFNCVDNYRTLSIVNETPSAGSVSGAGVYYPGTSVTVTATPSGSDEFQGWYDTLGTLKSMDNPYTFTMPGEDYTLSTFFGPAKGSLKQMGMYPQTKVTDTTIISALNGKGGLLPTAGNLQTWMDYGYYIEGVVTSYMWYKDVVHNSVTYRGVYYTEYRYTYTDSTAGCFNQQDHGYTKRIVYWFKYVPITWKVLDIDAGKAFLLAQTVLDAQDYFYAKTRRNIDGETVYANNYEHSHIRSWLNSSFLNAAFTTTEQNKIAVTTVDNSKATTINNVHNFDCPNTLDKVFLLSYLDLNGHYGFVDDASRVRYPSDYALSQAVSKDYDKAYWWTRSPYFSRAYNASRVNYNGALAAINVTDAAMGILPAIWINA